MADVSEVDGAIISKTAESSEQSNKEATLKEKPESKNVGSTELSTSDYYSDVTNELKRSDKEASPNQGTPVEDDPQSEVIENHFKDEEIKSGEEKSDTQDNKDKRKKKKKRRRRRHGPANQEASTSETKQDELNVEIEYVTEMAVQPGDPVYAQFHRVFEAFKLNEEGSGEVEESPMAIASRIAQEKVKWDKKDDSDEEMDKLQEQPMSKKKLRKLNRMSVATLKQQVEKPEVVEMHDVTSQDPLLLVHLKSQRNTVPVPRHWCLKRKYLQGKRGIEKPPFNLPFFIKDTGVMEMRQALQEKEDEKTLKAKTRERVRPKMGKLTIDYQKLHDAFFKWQTKPRLTIHGDLYYEGKEFETKLKDKKPGELSDELRAALGMPTGPSKHLFPPPWLIAMQRYGPPPSYPNLKIPGLNAPIPEGCSFGYFVGGWGKPPVDELGRPLYGDVFGMWQQDQGGAPPIEQVDRTLWGELESEEEEEMEEEEESEEEEQEEQPAPVDEGGLVTPAGLATPSGLTSIPAGMETPDMIQLRKKKIEEAMESGGETPALFTVLPEKSANVGANLMGSSHIYDLSAAVPGSVKKPSAGGGGAEGMEVALDPQQIEEIGMDAATTAKYEQEMIEKQLQQEGEDYSDMVAEHAARQKNKRKKAQVESGKAAKKLKEFKF